MPARNGTSHAASTAGRTLERRGGLPHAATPAPTRGVLTSVRHILEMIRFSHTLFALPFALFAAAMAWMQTAIEKATVDFHPPADIWEALQWKGASVIKPRLSDFWRPQELLGILLCMITARSAAMAFNRVADWKLDADNPRTHARHIPAGVLSVQSVMTFAVVASMGFVASTTLFLPNRLPLYLSLPVLAFLLGYSFAKRFTAWAHVWLGAALMLAPLSAWIAIRGDAVMARPFDLLPALVLGGAVLLWVTGFDIIYACLDADYDLQTGLHSVPARFGVRRALRIAAACHAGMIVMLAALPWTNLDLELGWPYLSGVAVVAALLAYEHWIVRPDDLTRVNLAFFNINVVVSLGLFIIGTVDLLT